MNLISLLSDAIEHLLSMLNPCEVQNVILTTKDELLHRTSENNYFLKTLAFNNNLPFHNNITLNKLCEYHHLSLPDRVKESVKINDLEYFSNNLSNVIKSLNKEYLISLINQNKEQFAEIYLLQSSGKLYHYVLIEALHASISKGYDVLFYELFNIIEIYGTDLLHIIKIAIQIHQTEILKYLLEKGNWNQEYKNQLLYTAALYGYLDIVILLIENGSNNIGDARRIAISHGNTNISDYLNTIRYGYF